MKPTLRRPLVPLPGKGVTWVTVLATALVLVPVIGLAVVCIDPPEAGLGEAVKPTWADYLFQIGADGEREAGPLPRSLALALLVCPLALFCGTILAYLNQRCEYRGRKILGRLGLLPFAIPSYLLAMTLRDALSPGGILGDLVPWADFTGLFAATFVLVLATTPYAQILIGGSLLQLGGAEEEAARSLGASSGRRFREILWPRLRPAAANALVLILLYTIADFGVVDVLDCRVLTWGIYQAWLDQQLALAAGLGFAALAVTLPLLLVSRLLQGRAINERRIENPRPPARYRLKGRALCGAYLLHAFQVGCGVLLPGIIVLTWIFPAVFRESAWDAGAWELLGRPILTSSLLAAAVAACALAFALGPAWLCVRGRGMFRRAAEATIYLVNAFPGVLIALGILATAIAISRWLEGPWHDHARQAGWLIVLGLALRFMAQAFAALNAAIGRLDPRQEECARSLGVSGRRLFGRVQLPALAPGVAGAALLVGVAVVKELPVTLMLQPREWTALSYQLYSSNEDGNEMQAGLAGCAIVALALIAHFALEHWRRRA